MSIKLDQHTCPRCLGGIPNDYQRGEYIGAMSRTDNKTEICSDCGQMEAIEEFAGGTLTPQSDWLFHIVMTPPEQRSQPLTVAEELTEGGV